MKLKYSLHVGAYLLLLFLGAFGVWAEELNGSAIKTEPQILEMMQAIEPGFIPKDKRANELFLLQKIADDAAKKISEKSDGLLQKKAFYSLKFSEALTQYLASRTSDLDETYEKAINDAIVAYEQALKDYPNDVNHVANALFAYGAHSFAVDEKIYFSKLAIYSAAREKGQEDVEYPEENFSRTIGAYERLLEEYPGFHDRESVYYLLSLALWYEGDFYRATSLFEALLKEYPQGRYASEIWFRLGEYLYDMDEYEEAIWAYGHILKNPEGSFKDKAHYKMGWSHFQLDQYSQMLENFVEVLNLTKDEKVDGVAVGMRAEVLRFIVKSFTEQLYLEEEKAQRIVLSKKTPAKASKEEMLEQEKEYAEIMGKMLAERVINYFVKGKDTPDYAEEVLLETASQLLEESKIDGAILALRAMGALNKNGQNAPKIESQIVEILFDANRLEEARKANHELINRFKKGSAWYKAMAPFLDARKQAREAVRDAILSLAVFYHKAGKDLTEAKQEDEARENFLKAASLYADYIDEYPERDDTHKALFYYAESAYELKKFALALEAYQLIKDYPLPMPESFRRDAVYNIVFTFRYVLEQEAKEERFKEVNFDELTGKSRGKEGQTIPPIGIRYLQAIDEFIEIAPNDDQVPVFLFHQAAIYYVYGHYLEAKTRFFALIEKYPETSAASVAARLVIDDAALEEDWERVAELSQLFKEQNLGGQAAQFERLQYNARFKLARSIFEEANNLKNNNQLSKAKEKYQESAKNFAVLLEEDPNSPYADIMLFNSARAIAQSGLMSEAIPLYKEVYKKYPKSDLANLARFQEALALEKMLKFKEAALAYDGIIKDGANADAAADAMLNKALLLEAAGEDLEAINAFLVFAKKYPDREEASDAYLTAAAIYKAKGQLLNQIAMLEQFIKQAQKDPDKRVAVIEAKVSVGDSYGDMAKASKNRNDTRRYEKLQKDSYSSALKLYSPELSSELAAFYAAKAQLFLEKEKQVAFRTMKINGRTSKTQADQLTAMMKKLTELSDNNEAVIRKYAQPVWNAESLYRIGLLYEHLASSMLKAPCPRDVDAIDEYACDEYIVLLEDKAAVLEEKALAALVQAYDIALSAYDAPEDLLEKIQKALNRLKPGKYQAVGKVISKPVVGATPSLGRMLNNGKMASALHPMENDPDVAKIESSSADGEQSSEEVESINGDQGAASPLENNEDGELENE